MVQPAEPKPPESASLLRRLAEAADGYRDGRPRIIVADRTPPHTVLGVFYPEQTEAIEAAVARGGPTADQFGPYATPATDPPREGQRRVVSVTATYTDGSTEQFSGEEYDALFWSVAAFDKFVMPYLTAAYWHAEATTRRGQFTQGATLMSTHYRHSF